MESMLRPGRRSKKKSVPSRVGAGALYPSLLSNENFLDSEKISGWSVKSPLLSRKFFSRSELDSLMRTVFTLSDAESFKTAYAGLAPDPRHSMLRALAVC
jgi:hypothetical protein